MSVSLREVVVVRSLTDSDLGLFAAHRVSAKSNQRAININADVARIMLSSSVFDAGGADFRCICLY